MHKVHTDMLIPILIDCRCSSLKQYCVPRGILTRIFISWWVFSLRLTYFLVDVCWECRKGSAIFLVESTREWRRPSTWIRNWTLPFRITTFVGTLTDHHLIIRLFACNVLNTRVLTTVETVNLRIVRVNSTNYSCTMFGRSEQVKDSFRRELFNLTRNATKFLSSF